MYIHKYIVNDQTIYLVTEKPSKPSKNLTLTGQDWKGRSTGASTGNAVKFLGQLEFSKEEKAEKAEKPKEKKAVSQVIRGYTRLLAALDEKAF